MEKSGSSVHMLDRMRGYLHVADALRREIRDMHVPEGARLPSERELAQRLRISRPSLREALIVLELQGEIEIRVGSGIYLKSSTPVHDSRGLLPSSEGPAPDDALMGHSPQDVSQTRYFLEGGVAAHAARFITREQLKVLNASVAAMRQAVGRRNETGDQPLADADRLFHVTLASTTSNRLLMQTLEGLFDQRYTPIGGSMHRLFDTESVWQDAVQEHQEIYNAVADRDPLQAQAAMYRHLTRAHTRLMAVIG